MEQCLKGEDPARCTGLRTAVPLLFICRVRDVVDHGTERKLLDVELQP